MTRDERERFADLFDRLLPADDLGQPCSDRDRDADRDSSLRLLSHALLNFLTVEGHQVADDLGDVLPWMASFLAWTRGDADPADMARHLAESPAVGSLSAPMIERRLSAHPTAGEAAVVRAPTAGTGAATSDDAHVHIVAALADTEARLAALADLSEDDLRARLIGDTDVLAAAFELCEDAADNPLADRLARAFEPWQTLGARQSDPLWILAGLEGDQHTRNPLAEDGFDLSKRARGFERGLAQNMARQGLIPAVRAALAFGGTAAGQMTAGQMTAGGMTSGNEPGLATSDERETFLRQFDVFRTAPALLELAAALMEVRHLGIDYVRGGAPLARLSGWTDYLRGACVELAEVRECPLREAMSYAHYCLHLVNICDFAAMGPDALNDQTRQTLSNLEDELKEFALAGQREGLSDQQADLGQFQRARWRRGGDMAYLADRLSRLRGAWRRGMKPAPMGAPPQMEPDVANHSLALIESHFDGPPDDAPAADVSGLVGLVEKARFVDIGWLEHLEPARILELVAVTVAAARDLPGVDVSQPFEVDLGPLGRFATDPGRGRLNRRILSALLERRTMADILGGAAEPSALRRGIVGQSFGGPGAGRLTMRFVADPELEALLELIVTTSADDDSFHATLDRRLQDMLDHRGAADRPDADPSGAPDDPVDNAHPRVPPG